MALGTDTDAQMQALGPWFHNLHLPGGRQTAPDHRFGDFPAFKWRQIAPHLPEDLTGRRVLDIGCNAGFYSFQLAERGADVVGLDFDEHYLRQARWAAECMGLSQRVEFRRGNVYEVGAMSEHFDLVVFMGVFYHLRYPLLALDGIARLAPDLLVFQTLTCGDSGKVEAAVEDLDFEARDRLSAAGWPRMAFIEKRFAGDPTNWWAPNRSGVLAMLRSAGFAIVHEPGDEIFLCRPDAAAKRDHWQTQEWDMARTALAQTGKPAAVP